MIKSKAKAKKKTVIRGRPKPIQLPDKLSELLDVSVTDMQKIRNTPGYVLNMDCWHVSPDDAEDGSANACQVCMAGSVMACTLKVSPTRSAEPWDRGMGKNRNKLLAINSMREGNFTDALAALRGLGIFEDNSSLELGLNERIVIGHARDIVSGGLGSDGVAQDIDYRMAAAVLRVGGL